MVLCLFERATAQRETPQLHLSEDQNVTAPRVSFQGKKRHSEVVALAAFDDSFTRYFKNDEKEKAGVSI